MTMMMMGMCCTFAFNVTMLTDLDGLNHNKFGHNIASYGEVIALNAINLFFN